MKSLLNYIIETDISPDKVWAWRRENTRKGKVPNKPGMYKFYDKNGKLLYVGHASRLRHRVQSYIQNDDFSAHRTKAQLRQHIHKYEYNVMPEHKARQLEKKVKKKAVFNYL